MPGVQAECLSSISRTLWKISINSVRLHFIILTGRPIDHTWSRKPKSTRDLAALSRSSRCELVSIDMEESSSDGSEIPKSLSPDKLCLQPMKYHPGFSQLCNLCIQVFFEREEDESRPHIEFLSTLEESAKRGCRLCNLISECFIEHVQGKPITTLSLVSLRYKQGDFYEDIEFESLSMQRKCSIQCESIERKSR